MLKQFGFIKQTKIKNLMLRYLKSRKEGGVSERKTSMHL